MPSNPPRAIGWFGATVHRTSRSSPSRQRNVQRVIAEGDSTTIQTGTGRNLLRIRGQRVVLDVEAEKAVITGAPGKPVRSTKGEGESEVDGVWTEATIDLVTGLPTFRGPKIILRGK